MNSTMTLSGILETPVSKFYFDLSSFRYFFFLVYEIIYVLWQLWITCTCPEQSESHYVQKKIFLLIHNNFRMLPAKKDQGR